MSEQTKFDRRHYNEPLIRSKMLLYIEILGTYGILIFLMLERFVIGY